MTSIVVALESWAEAGAEIQLLAKLAWDETVPELEPGRIFALDTDVLAQMSEMGVLMILTARRERQLLGYISWVLSFDLESRGVLIAQQGSWYVLPKQGPVALALLQRSLAELRGLGVKWVYAHWRACGRSALAEPMLARLGFRPIQHTASLCLETMSHA